MTYIYTDPIIQKYLDLFKAKNKDIKGVFHGEPYQIAASEMPAVFITKRGTEVSVLTNSQDQHEMLLRITVVVDIRSEINEHKHIVAGVAKLMEIIEGRTPGTFVLKDTSLLNILRTNVTVDSANNLRTNLGSITRVDYTEVLNRRNDGNWFVESHIEFVASFAQTR